MQEGSEDLVELHPKKKKNEMWKFLLLCIIILSGYSEAQIVEMNISPKGGSQTRKIDNSNFQIDNGGTFTVKETKFPNYKLHPPLIRGTITINLPIVVFPRDSFGGSSVWIPIPEMGFTFNPILPFKEGNGFWEFPIQILTFFPFLEKWAALGDFQLGVGFQIPPIYKFDVHYRFLSGKYYPMGGKFQAHMAGVDIMLPIKGFSAAGVSVDWVFDLVWTMTASYSTNGGEFGRYDGTIALISPYWKFPLNFGKIILYYRFVVASKLVGVDNAKQSKHIVRNSSTSTLEVKFLYP